MENTSYALYIAVGVLIAIVILSILLFNWRRIGLLESSKDETVIVKNRAEFNAEYEAYNKNLMYGTDVLSCLNKAQNNNQKYVYNNYYGTDPETLGKDDRAEFFIDVEVTINETLYDEVRAYYKDRAGKYQRAIGLGTDSTTQANYGDKVFYGSGVNKFKDPTIIYYYFKKGKVYQETSTYTNVMWSAANRTKNLYNILNTGKIETMFTGGKTYNLLTSEDTNTVTSLDETAKLAALITTVSLKNQELTNNDKPSAFDKSDWWYCTWTTAASDFKTRKFKCTNVKYNEDTGYIEKISFSEI